MQTIGHIAESGFTETELEQAGRASMERGYQCSLYELNHGIPEVEADEAFVLVIRNGVSMIVNIEEFMEEIQHMSALVDTQAWMHGRVVNKKARYNLCYADLNQEPNYAQKQGRVISFEEVPVLAQIRAQLPGFLGAKAENLYAELNWYYDVTSTGIGFHGDSERKRVVGVRMGADLPLHYQWYLQGNPIGERMIIELHHGDIYVMSEKAVGNDWKRRTIPTLRHATGSAKYIA